MRQAKFERLVSEYLDGEITEAELNQLREELALSPERRMIFNGYRRLNAATCKARFSAECLALQHHTRSRRLTYAWGFWGGAAGAMAGLALFVFFAGNVKDLQQTNPGVQDDPVALAELRQEAYWLARDARERDSGPRAGQQPVAGPTPAPFLSEPLQAPPLFPVSPVHLGGFRVGPVMEEAQQGNLGGAYSAVPVLFRAAR